LKDKEHVIQITISFYLVIIINLSYSILLTDVVKTQNSYMYNNVNELFFKLKKQKLHRI